MAYTIFLAVTKGKKLPRSCSREWQDRIKLVLKIDFEVEAGHEMVQ
jgi:hypothetical protein